MPNWCENTVVFYVENQEEWPQLKRLWGAFNIANSKNNGAVMPDRKYGFGEAWLGNILTYLSGGLIPGEPGENYPSPDDPGAYLGSVNYTYNDEPIHCRGSLTFLEYKDDVGYLPPDALKFTIDTETAWGPMMKIYNYVIYLLNIPAVKFVFRCEETGMGLFFNSDTDRRFLPEEFFVDSSVPHTSIDQETGKDKFFMDYDYDFIKKENMLNWLNTRVDWIKEAYEKGPDVFLGIPDGIEDKLIPQTDIEAARNLILDAIDGVKIESGTYPGSDQVIYEEPFFYVRQYENISVDECE